MERLRLIINRQRLRGEYEKSESLPDFYCSVRSEKLPDLGKSFPGAIKDGGVGLHIRLDTGFLVKTALSSVPKKLPGSGFTVEYAKERCVNYNGNKTGEFLEYEAENNELARTVLLIIAAESGILYNDDFLRLETVPINDGGMLARAFRRYDRERQGEASEILYRLVGERL